MIDKKRVYILPKKEHLIGKKNIVRLYEDGQRVVETPLLAIFITTDSVKNVRVLFSVPKKIYKRAVDRNRYKRILREAYRLNKIDFANFIKNKDFGINIAFCVVSNDRIDILLAKEKIVALLNNITEKLN